MRILLINPPIRDVPAYFPLGLGYITRILKDSGYNIEVLDINAYRYSEEAIRKRLRESKYDIIGITGLITQYKYVKWLVSLSKECNQATKVIIGGAMATSIPELLLEKTKADIVILNEGEITIKEIIKALENKTSLKKIKGIYYREKNKVIKNPKGDFIKNLDELKFPAYELFPTEIYVKNIGGLSWTNKINIISNRGCPYKCVYCYRNFGNIVRSRGIDNFIAEIKFLNEKYGVEYFCINDELFIVNKERVYEFCDKLLKENLNIKWGCNGRANIVDEELLKRMKEAGCKYVAYGIESGSQKILDTMKKQVTIEQAKRAILLTKKIGIFPVVTLMVGIEGETKETIQESIDFCKETDSLINTIFFITAFPGTELYEIAKKQGKIKDEEKYIESLGEMSENLLINFTDMGDEELIRLKKLAEREIKENYARKHKIKTMIRYVNYARRYYKLHGLKSLIKRGVQELRFEH